MSSSSSNCLLSGPKDHRRSLLDTEDYGTVYVGSVRITQALGLGVHHGIVVSVSSYNYYIAYQWGSGCKSSFYAYATCYDSSNTCMKLGRHKCSQVYKAANDASHGAQYGSSYNCNHWTIQVARKLGHSINVHWNCSCVM